EKGAYTDASTPEKGLLAAAEGGTLLLDEVDSLSAAAQGKLLRFLQDHEYRPLGSGKPVRADVRVIAATNADLRELVAARMFRADLFYRLNVLTMHIPRLADRTEDIPLLAKHFLDCFAVQNRRPSMSLSRSAIHKLVTYDWPGNVRELDAVI